jgi:hypothetical protein
MQVPLQQRIDSLYTLSGITIFAFLLSAVVSCCVFFLWLRMNGDERSSIWSL